MIKIIMISVCVLFGPTVFAQTEKIIITTEDSIQSVITELFKGMLDADSSRIQNTFANSAILQTIAKNKEGQVHIETEKVSDFASSVAKMKKGDADEKVEFNQIFIDGPLASVWAPYKFYYKGKYSHSGIDSFQLVRINGEWKIQYLIDTRRK
ncbi:MAG: nuclear transport factor 2 family protein [Chitinophagaceae bacterium]